VADQAEVDTVGEGGEPESLVSVNRSAPPRARGVEGRRTKLRLELRLSSASGPGLGTPAPANLQVTWRRIGDSNP